MLGCRFSVLCLSPSSVVSCAVVHTCPSSMLIQSNPSEAKVVGAPSTFREVSRTASIWARITVSLMAGYTGCGGMFLKRELVSITNRMREEA